MGLTHTLSDPVFHMLPAMAVKSRRRTNMYAGTHSYARMPHNGDGGVHERQRIDWVKDKGRRAGVGSVFILDSVPESQTVPAKHS